MTPAEHRAEAERLLAEAKGISKGYRFPAEVQRMLATAQVHATLACAPVEPGGYDR